MNLNITLGVFLYLFFFGIAMELDEDFNFEQNQFDSHSWNDAIRQNRQLLKSQIQFSKFGLSDVLLSELREKSQNKFSMVAEREESPIQCEFNSEIGFEENKFENLDWNALLFIPKTSTDFCQINKIDSDENFVQFNVNAGDFVSKTTYNSGDQQSPRTRRASDYKFWKSKEYIPPRKQVLFSRIWSQKNEKSVVYQNMKYESDGKMWEREEDPDVMLELIGHGYENSYQYEAIIKIVQKTHLKYRKSADMREKKNAILEPLKFTQDKTIYDVLKKDWYGLEGFNPWNRDVFQVAANKIGINIESPVAVALLKNANSLDKFKNTSRKVYKSKSISEALSTLKKITLLDHKEEDVEIFRQYLQRVGPLFVAYN